MRFSQFFKLANMIKLKNNYVERYINNVLYIINIFEPNEMIALTGISLDIYMVLKKEYNMINYKKICDEYQLNLKKEEIIKFIQELKNYDILE